MREVPRRGGEREMKTYNKSNIPLPRSAPLTVPSSEEAMRSVPEKTIYALGFFDGVHLGHQALLQNCREMADLLGCKAGVVTFISHPDALVQGNTPRLINTPADRKTLLQQYRMDTVLELPFDRALMEMSWKDFIRLLIEEYRAKGFVCGTDFKFGYKGTGTAAHLVSVCRKEGLLCRVIPEQTMDGITISSTYIRSLLESGQMEQAVRFLGHPHILTGTVVSGRKLGHTIGVPTANLQPPEAVLLPRCGVYACSAFADGKAYIAVTNIGSRPTVGGHHITVEPWLLDFAGDLYGKQLTLAFYDFLRPEQAFGSLEQLKAQIEKDAARARKIFENL